VKTIGNFLPNRLTRKNLRHILKRQRLWHSRSKRKIIMIKVRWHISFTHAFSAVMWKSMFKRGLPTLFYVTSYPRRFLIHHFCKDLWLGCQDNFVAVELLRRDHVLLAGLLWCRRTDDFQNDVRIFWIVKCGQQILAQTVFRCFWHLLRCGNCVFVIWERTENKKDIIIE